MVKGQTVAGSTACSRVGRSLLPVGRLAVLDQDARHQHAQRPVIQHLHRIVAGFQRVIKRQFVLGEAQLLAPSRVGLRRSFAFYNTYRSHTALGYDTPDRRCTLHLCCCAERHNLRSPSTCPSGLPVQTIGATSLRLAAPKAFCPAMLVEHTGVPANE